ncbi:MAG: protease modulator HflC [Alphaproteobacteria bacterium]|nr:protease modulator HflC [Alphaproteobacteria bacterium]
MDTKLLVLFVILALALLIGSQSFFTVDQREQAIVLQLGQPKGEPRGPGLHFKLPFVQNVRYFDRRILSIDPNPEQVVISSSKSQAVEEPKKDQNEENEANTDLKPTIGNVSGEPIIVDTFLRYRIVDPLQFMKTLRTVDNANKRIESIVNDSTKAVLGDTTLPELLSEQRTVVMAAIKNRVNKKVTDDSLGIDIIDVRIVRADLTKELRDSTVRQMNAALAERATERKAKGEEKALEIRSTARKDRDIILAEARRDSEIIRGEGDRQAIKIYADAFNVDKEFYSFLRSMEAYKNTMGNSDTRMILTPDGEFFKHFNKQQP